MQSKLTLKITLIITLFGLSYQSKKDHFVGYQGQNYKNEKMNILIKNVKGKFMVKKLVKETYLGVYDDFLEFWLKGKKIAEIQIAKDSRSRRVRPYINDKLGGLSVARSTIHKNPWKQNLKGTFYLYYFENELLLSGIKVGQLMVHKSKKNWFKKNLKFLK